MSNSLTLDAHDLELDPAVNPRAFEGVRTRRAFAFLIDATLIFALMVVAYIAISIVGVLTLGIGFFPLPAVWPVVAIVYSVLSVGGPHQATPGMRFMGIQIRSLDGEPVSYGIAALHALGFWVSVAILTPLILVVPLFTARKQLLHDLILGTVAVRD